MPLFAYTARDSRGSPLKGELEAVSAQLVAEQLMSRGMTPIRIDPAASVPERSKSLNLRFGKPGVKLEEIVMLARQMRTLTKAGVPILRGLQGLADTTDNPTLAETLTDVHRQLQGGRELHAALAKHPRVFSPLFVSLVHVGENTGRLDEALGHLADYLEVEKQTRERISSAVRYPLVVMSAIVVALVIMNIFVIPTFAEAFARYNAELPLMTRVLIGSSNFFVAYWHWLLVALLVSLFGFRAWRKKPGGKLLWSRVLLRAPLVGPIIRKAVLGRFAQSLSLTIRSGVPLIHALNVVAGVVDNAFVSERVQSMRAGIEKGDSVSRTAAATGLFTPLVLQMLAVGEETGALDQLLEETAQHYQAEVEFELKRLADAIEPIMITVIGVLVAVLALGVFLPLWDLSSAARGG
ncbi:MAG: type II secretion system F family protein [Gammaproteobacteria bacterium]|nr:type II secretion system F family protein [Gammaproteobacteria bacterium]